MARILIIDDNDFVRNMLKETMERAGYEVETAVNGVEGVERFRKISCDLVITDLIMPEKEGIETIMDLKKDFPAVKIIAISGGGRVGPTNYLKFAEMLGAAYTFTKPVDRKALLKAVKVLLQP
ncbi:MAG: response regulator [Desulfobacteraceae bacterium]|nr:response regulator [Desulfobacteraceae bacterium]